MNDSKTKFKIRARSESTGKVSVEMITKRQIAEGLPGKDLNIEDIGIALLNDLRKEMGLEAIEAVSEDDDNDDDNDEPFDS